MSCSICGRNSCISSFHSIEEQSEHEVIKGKIIQSVTNILLNKANRLQFETINDEYYVKLDDVISMIENTY